MYTYFNDALKTFDLFETKSLITFFSIECGLFGPPTFEYLSRIMLLQLIKIIAVFD